MVRVWQNGSEQSKERARREWLEDLDRQTRSHRERKENERIERLLEHPIMLDPADGVAPMPVVPVADDSITRHSRRRSMSAILKFEAAQREQERIARYEPKTRQHAPRSLTSSIMGPAAPQAATGAIARKRSASHHPAGSSDYFWTTRTLPHPRLHEQHSVPVYPAATRDQYGQQIFQQQQQQYHQQYQPPPTTTALSSPVPALFRPQHSQYARLKPQFAAEDPQASQRSESSKEWRLFLEQQIQEKRDRERDHKEYELEQDRIILRQHMYNSDSNQHGGHTALSKPTLPWQQDQPSQPSYPENSVFVHPRLTDTVRSTFGPPQRQPNPSQSLAMSKSVYDSYIPRPAYLLHIKTTAAQVAGKWDEKGSKSWPVGPKANVPHANTSYANPVKHGPRHYAAAQPVAAQHQPVRAQPTAHHRPKPVAQVQAPQAPQPAPAKSSPSSIPSDGVSSPKYSSTVHRVSESHDAATSSIHKPRTLERRVVTHKVLSDHTHQHANQHRVRMNASDAPVIRHMERLTSTPPMAAGVPRSVKRPLAQHQGDPVKMQALDKLRQFESVLDHERRQLSRELHS
ncbi:hypothetical protein BC831DRAFT_514331 [Entophlyctis helioformis]|nr:hypothetical protein BC831DRAFT_514331 [Entophlyctis helioformis]